MKETTVKKVLFVCMGNICRSPTAEGVFMHQVREHGLTAQIQVDSAGTHAYHCGEPPDSRAIRAAARRGIDLTPLRARRVREEDFAQFDYIVAMDADNLDYLSEFCPEQYRHKLCLLLDFAPEQPLREVPDPYYGGDKDFERVLDLAQTASAALLDKIRADLAVANA